MLMDLSGTFDLDSILYGTRISRFIPSYLDILLFLRDGHLCSGAHFQRVYALPSSESKKLMNRLIAEDMVVPSGHKSAYKFNQEKDKEVLQAMFKSFDYDKPSLINELFNYLASVRKPFMLFTLMKKLKQKGIIRNSKVLEKLTFCGVLSSWFEEDKGKLYFPKKVPLEELKSKLLGYNILK